MSSTTYPAVVYENTAAAPLLEKESSTATDSSPVFSRFSANSLFLGLLVGVFIQLSTLGANYLVIEYWGEDFVTTISQRDIVVFSLAWSFVTSTMAMVVLAFVRNMFSSSYNGQDFDDMVLHLECRFVVGALIGVCTAWAATDAALGMSEQIVYSFATLAVALGWCRFMMWFFSKDSEEESAAQEGIIIIV